MNGVLRYSQGNRYDGWSVTGMAYHAEWAATDQVPKRAIDSSQIKRFGSLDPTSGGETHRYSLSSADWARRGQSSQVARTSGHSTMRSISIRTSPTAPSTSPPPAIATMATSSKQKDRRQAGGFDASHYRL